MIELILPAPPSANRMYRVGKGRMYRASAYKSWLSETYYLIDNRPDHPIEKLVSVHVDAYPLDGRRRDLDNYLKASLDGLEYWRILSNDRLVSHLAARRHAPGAFDDHRIRIRVYLDAHK